MSKELTLNAPTLPAANKMSPEEIAAILPHIKFIEGWLKDIKTHALHEAEDGNPPPGYKLVEGRSVRKLRTDVDIEQILMAQGLTPEQFKSEKFVGVTAIEKLLGGKKEAAPIMKQLTIKPDGKPTLVPTSDKRDAIPAGPEADFS